MHGVIRSSDEHTIGINITVNVTIIKNVLRLVVDTLNGWFLRFLDSWKWRDAQEVNGFVLFHSP